MTIHLSRKTLVALPLLVIVLAAAVWGGAAFAVSSPTPVTVCVNPGKNVTTKCGPAATTYTLVTSQQLDALTARVTTLESNVSALQTLLNGVSRPDANT